MSNRFQNSSEVVEKYKSQTHLNTISNLLQQLQTRNNINLVRQIWANVQSMETMYLSQVSKLSKQLNKSSSFYLSLKQVQKMLKILGGNFAEVLEQIPDRRIESLYNQILHISYRLKTIEPTSIHTHSTRMKQHLLQQIRDEKKKRQNLQKDYVAMVDQLQRLSQISQNRAEQKQNQIQQYNQIEFKFRQLAHEMNIMKQANLKLKDSNEELKKQTRILSQQLKQPCDLCQSKDLMIKQLSSGFKKCSEQLQQAVEDGNRIAQNEQIMKNQIERFEQQVQKLQRIRLDRQNNITQLQAQIINLKQSNQIMSTNQSSSKIKINQLQKQINDLNTKLQQNEQQIQHLKQQNEALNQDIQEYRRLQNLSELQRENFLSKTEQLENKIQQMQYHQNELLEMQDNSQNQIIKLSKQLQQKEKSANIYMSTADKLRKQLSDIKKRQDEIIQQKSDESSDDGLMRIQAMIQNTSNSKNNNIYNASQKKRSQFSTPHKGDIDLLNDTNKRSNPEIEIVQDELLRMLLTQALSLQSFIEAN